MHNNITVIHTSIDALLTTTFDEGIIQKHGVQSVKALMLKNEAGNGTNAGGL